MVHVESRCFANQTYCFFDVLVTVRVGSTDLLGHGRGGVGWILASHAAVFRGARISSLWGGKKYERP